MTPLGISLGIAHFVVFKRFYLARLTRALLGLWIFHRLLGGGGRLNAPPHDLGSWSP